MSVTVRTLQTNPPSEADRKIGWIDRPILCDIEHADAQQFTIDQGILYVWKSATATSDRPLAAYAPACWVSATVDTEARRTEPRT